MSVSKSERKHFDVAIVGGGLAGLTAALTLHRRMRAAGQTPSIALIAPKPPVADGRTTALLGKSVDHLKWLGVWQKAEDQAAALSTMRIVDGTSRLWRAPPVEFKVSELGLQAFGYNIANSVLGEIMRGQISEIPDIEVVDRMVGTAKSGNDYVDLEFADGETMTAALVIAADGRNSRLRDSVGIGTRKWRYPQSAIAVNFTHSLPHHTTSTEFHTEEGPFTIVPMPSLEGRHQSGLVYVVRPEKIDAILDLPTDRLERHIEERMQSMLGKIELSSKPQCFPLSGMVAKRFGADRVALVGDAAHVFPPIGAQGFNLGMRDVIEICSLASDALNRGGDPGAADLLNRYHRNRQSDITARTGAVDLLNRSLLTDFLPVQALRGVGLYALATIPPLRKMLMKSGMALNRDFATATSS